MKEFRCSRAFGGEQDRDYAKALSTCESADDVRALVQAYRELALDAAEQVEHMTAADFKEFQAGLRKERRGQYAGDVWASKFGAILMPLPMMRITEIAHQFCAPFGVAWFRCRELRPDLLKVDPPAAAPDPPTPEPRT